MKSFNEGKIEGGGHAGLAEQPEAAGESIEDKEDKEKFEDYLKRTLKDIEDQSSGVIQSGKQRIESIPGSTGYSAEEVARLGAESGTDQKLAQNEGAIRALAEQTREQMGQISGGELDEASRGDGQQSAVAAEEAPLKSQERLGFKEQVLKDEASYLAGHVEKEGLEKRYKDETTEASYVLGQVESFAAERGVEHATIPELEGQAFGPEARAIIFEAVKKQAESFLFNKEKGRFRQKKYESVVKEAGRYLDLVLEAQNEGDIAKGLDARAVLRMAEENVAILAFQDRIASENLMGDHGVRHLVDHNITVSEKILDQVAANGQTVKSIDRLLLHQIMIDHDLGYAMSPVRDATNRDGIQGQDAGHNLLAAKFIRQRAGNAEDHLGKIFSKEQLAVIHASILNHDSSAVDIRIGEDGPEARRANVESAVHIADNTHVFEDKLPELLYEVPDSLRTMRLMKAAGEIEDEGMIEYLKQRLVLQIRGSPDFSDDDKEALSQAVSGLGKESYQFSVGRICGNKPDVSIDRNGRVKISVEESAIHQEAVGLFSQQSYDQLRKFIAGLTGLKRSQVTDEMLNREEIGNEKLVIALSIHDKRASEKTDYQKRIEALITDPEFQHYVEEDAALSREDGPLKAVKPENMESLVDSNRLRREGDTRPARDIINERLKAIQEERKVLLSRYAKTGNKPNAK